ncbi:uncharacterized protein LOC132800005 [Ziziphus jujuba]|uniref:Uncharacterized protein LOC132800005 n=1 Tax=Ziziphus jujuba TaxID=326968 RepID=A0ABM3ZWJ8_ZIZJJ|nr:uncharacterized protein LOC132800005 [Ziziphus jujuba]
MGLGRSHKNIGLFEIFLLEYFGPFNRNSKLIPNDQDTADPSLPLGHFCPKLKKAIVLSLIVAPRGRSKEKSQLGWPSTIVDLEKGLPFASKTPNCKEPKPSYSRSGKGFHLQAKPQTAKNPVQRLSSDSNRSDKEAVQFVIEKLRSLTAKKAWLDEQCFLIVVLIKCVRYCLLVSLLSILSLYFIEENLKIHLEAFY